MRQKWLPLLLSLLLLTAGAGCGKYAPEPGGTGGGSETGQNGSAPLGLQETGQVGGLQITLNQVETLDEGPGLSAGYEYVLINLTVRNEGAAAFTMNSQQFSLTTAPGDRAPYNPQATMQRSPQFRGTLLPGEEMQGWLGFMAAAESGPYSLTFKHASSGSATWQFSAP